MALFSRIHVKPGLLVWGYLARQHERYEVFRVVGCLRIVFAFAAWRLCLNCLPGRSIKKNTGLSEAGVSEYIKTG